MKRYIYIILLLLTIFNLYTVFAYGKAGSARTLVVERIVVSPGDTLWDIAKKTRGDHAEDIREYIYEIKRINNMEGSVIAPGDTILVPVDFN